MDDVDTVLSTSSTPSTSSSAISTCVITWVLYWPGLESKFGLSYPKQS